MTADGLVLSWVVLTMGDRQRELANALRSLTTGRKGDPEVVLVVNGGPGLAEVPPGVTVIVLPENLGIPEGRDRGLAAAGGDVIGFLDDDAVLLGDQRQVTGAFERSSDLGAVALRLVDDGGETARRHVPRLGAKGATRSGPVATFLGGACAVRRSAYVDSGGYFTQLFYGHEELELSWRLVDHGWSIEYLADCLVRHPKTAVGRHPEGWRRTGSNRVLVARRTLPRPVSVVHALVWLVLGAARAPDWNTRWSYVAAWLAAWRRPIDRAPIAWNTVWELARLGRPPVV